MKKLLVTITAVAFLLSLLYGYTVYQNHIPPFKEGTCIEFDYSKLYSDYAEGDKETPVLGTITRNSISEGTSDVILAYEMFPGVFGASLESIPFYNLRLAKPVEVSCD